MPILLPTKQPAIPAKPAPTILAPKLAPASALPTILAPTILASKPTQQPKLAPTSPKPTSPQLASQLATIQAAATTAQLAQLAKATQLPDPTRPAALPAPKLAPTSAATTGQASTSDWRAKLAKSTPATKPATPKAATPAAAASLAQRSSVLALQAKLANLATRTTDLATAPTPTQHAKQLASVARTEVQLTPKHLAQTAATLGLQLPAYQLATPEASGRVEKHQITMDLLNSAQREAVELASAGRSFNLIGSAGSGKTTTQRMVLQELATSGSLRTVPADWEHKYLPKGILSVVVLSYMNKAVNNIRSALPTEFKSNALTIHKFLEYSPVLETISELNADGVLVERERKVFKPQRHSLNQIVGITHIVIEEASTVDMILWNQLLDALPNRGEGVSFIKLGDICQIPPVMGESILRNSLSTGHNVELTQIYRTAADSPIKSLAISINEGKPFSDLQLREKFHRESELEFVNLSGKRKDGSYQPRETGHEVVHKIANMYKKFLASGQFVPFRDTILCPYRVNKDNGLNCEHLNLLLADFEGKRRDAVVHEVIAGFQRKYLAIGDPIVLAKQEYRIVNIQPNKAYKGLPAKPASSLLNRTGHYDGDDEAELLELESLHTDTILSIDINALLAKKDADEAAEESTTRTASHIITISSVDSDPELADIETEVSQVGQIADIDFAYATSVHKSIGSEWERVYLCLHHSMASHISREILYTAVTRAKLYLQIVYDGQDWSNPHKPNTSLIAKAITTPRIKGNTLAEKIKWIEQQEAQAKQTSGSLLSKFKPKPKTVE